MNEITQEAIELMESTDVIDNTALLEQIVHLTTQINNLLTLVTVILLVAAYPVLKGLVTSWFKL